MCVHYSFWIAVIGSKIRNIFTTTFWSCIFTTVLEPSVWSVLFCFWFLTALEGGNSRWRCQWTPCLVRATSWLTDSCLIDVTSHDTGWKGALWGLLYKGANLIHEDSAFMTLSAPKGPLMPSVMALDFNIWLGGVTNIQLYSTVWDEHLNRQTEWNRLLALPTRGGPPPIHCEPDCLQAGMWIFSSLRTDSD